MKALVGYTGFVGSNLYDEGNFDRVYNSHNIEEAYGTKPELLVYAGLRAEKYLANHAPEQDMELILQAEDNIRRIAPQKLILISTIDVFGKPWEVDENTSVNVTGLHAYGLNRYRLEVWVRERYPDAVIVRLPGLFGRNMKKNFIYDMIHMIPTMLKSEKMDELVQKDPGLLTYYTLQGNGFYRVKSLDSGEEACLKKSFERAGFSALNFTDSRSIYQFYNLKRLWGDLLTVLNEGILLWHPAVEPVSAGELYQYITGLSFRNELPSPPARYDYRTIYDTVFHGKNGYICDKGTILKEIKEFIQKC